MPTPLVSVKRSRYDSPGPKSSRQRTLSIQKCPSAQDVAKRSMLISVKPYAFQQTRDSLESQADCAAATESHYQEHPLHGLEPKQASKEASTLTAWHKRSPCYMKVPDLKAQAVIADAELF